MTHKKVTEEQDTPYYGVGGLSGCPDRSFSDGPPHSLTVEHTKIIKVRDHGFQNQANMYDTFNGNNVLFKDQKPIQVLWIIMYSTYFKF